MRYFTPQDIELTNLGTRMKQLRQLAPSPSGEGWGEENKILKLFHARSLMTVIPNGNKTKLSLWI
jgi:hypothetical protein